MKTKLYVENLKNYLIPVLSLVVVIALVPLVVLPQLNQIASASKVINQNKDRLDQIKAKDQALQKLDNDKATLTDELNVVEAGLPVDKAIPQLVLGITKVAKDNGLNVTSLKMQPGKTATPSAKPASSNANAQSAPAIPTTTVQSNDTLIFTLSVSGTLDQLKGFLGTIERAKRVILVKQFSSTSGSGGISNYVIQISLSTPFGPLPTLSPDQIAQPVSSLSDENKKVLTDLQNNSTDFVTGEVGTVPTGVPNPYSP